MEDIPPHVEHIMDSFTYQLSLLYQRAKIWLGYRHTIYLHIQSTVCRSQCFPGVKVDGKEVKRLCLSVPYLPFSCTFLTLHSEPSILLISCVFVFLLTSCPLPSLFFCFPPSPDPAGGTL